MRKVIKLILSLIIIISLGIIIYKCYLYYLDNKTYSEIKKNKPEVVDFKNNRNGKSLNEEKLLNINNDYKFWLTISNTDVDYPVVQCDNNDFYLEHDFNKGYSISGTLFVDYRNDIEEDKNIIIYGHNMRNGTMFNNINKFKDKDFFTNNYISIIKNNREYKYEVFSVYVISEEEVSFRINFKDNDEYLKYLEELNEKSLYKKEGAEKNRDSNIITLITCSYEYDNARTIIHAKLLK
ncbi:class B sortase [Clostridium isatidis]|uniref:class B sortase n=1 Tax=Clostridium isatidis TaxID=182773 RepID=UPI003AAE0749